MAEITIKKLLEPVSKNKPCGKILFDDGDFQHLLAIAKGKEETQWDAYEPPNWKNVLRLSKGVLLKGKDLNAIIIFIYALANLEGFVGMVKGFEFLKQNLEKYWDNLQPELDDADEDDFAFARLSPIATMCTQGSQFRKTIQEMNLFPTRQIGAFSYNELCILGSETSLREGRLEKLELENLAENLHKDKYDEMIKFLRECKSLCIDMNSFITEKVGVVNNVSKFESFVEFISEIITVMEKCANSLSEQESEIDEVDEYAETEVSGKASQKRTVVYDGVIESEAHALDLLKEIKRWYEINIHVSPIPVILERAIKVAGMSFLDILDELLLENGEAAKTILNTKIGIIKKDGEFRGNSKVVKRLMPSASSKKTLGNKESDSGKKEEAASHAIGMASSRKAPELTGLTKVV